MSVYILLLHQHHLLPHHHLFNRRSTSSSSSPSSSQQPSPENLLIAFLSFFCCCVSCRIVGYRQFVRKYLKKVISSSSSSLFLLFLCWSFSPSPFLSLQREFFLFFSWMMVDCIVVINTCRVVFLFSSLVSYAFSGITPPPTLQLHKSGRYDVNDSRSCKSNAALQRLFP